MIFPRERKSVSSLLSAAMRSVMMPGKGGKKLMVSSTFSRKFSINGGVSRAETYALCPHSPSLSLVLLIGQEIP